MYVCVQHGDDANFLWRLSKATFFQSQVEATRDRNEQKRLVYQALDYAGRALKLDDNNPDVHKWSVPFIVVSHLLLYNCHWSSG